MKEHVKPQPTMLTFYIKVPDLVLTTLLPIQLLENISRKAAEVNYVLGPLLLILGNQDELLGSWLQSRPKLAMAGIWE